LFSGFARNARSDWEYLFMDAINTARVSSGQPPIYTVSVVQRGGIMAHISVPDFRASWTPRIWSHILLMTFASISTV
jgi:hypothetical protein